MKGVRTNASEASFAVFSGTRTGWTFTLWRNVFVKLSNAVSAEAPPYSRQIMKKGFVVFLLFRVH